MGGVNASMRYDGFYKINPGFKKTCLLIYLEEGVNANSFINDFEASMGDFVMNIVDIDKNLELNLGIYTSLVSRVGLAILFVTIFVIILVLYFVINSTVIRMKRNLGIQKALGFTTLQLMNQISLSFLLPALIGVVIGSLVGMTQTNTLLSFVQRDMGIMRTEYIIPPTWVLAFAIIVFLVSYVTSLLVTLKIRNISPYTLIND